jgi:hypothetical protein
MAANMTDDLLNDDMDFMLAQVAENISFFFLLKLKILEAKTLTTCSIKNCLPRHWLLAYVTKISLLKCDRRQSHICFRLTGYDTNHLEYL